MSTQRLILGNSGAGPHLGDNEVCLIVTAIKPGTTGCASRKLRAAFSRVSSRRKSRRRSSKLLPHYSRKRAGRACVKLSRHAARQIRQTSRFDSQLHGLRHFFGIVGGGDRGIHEHAVGAEFHGYGGV